MFTLEQQRGFDALVDGFWLLYYVVRPSARSMRARTVFSVCLLVCGLVPLFRWHVPSHRMGLVALHACALASPKKADKQSNQVITSMLGFEMLRS